MRIAGIVCVALALALVGAAIARSTPAEEARGSRVLSELESGALDCGDVSAADFELVGEYAMGRMFVSPRQHEAMNRMMTRAMGDRGEEIAHEAMGRRFSGCGGGRLPAGFGRMMGAAVGMGMMGGYGFSAVANPSDDDSGVDHMGDWGAGWWILMALMMVVFWGLAILGVVWLVRTLAKKDGRG